MMNIQKPGIAFGGVPPVPTVWTTCWLIVDIIVTQSWINVFFWKLLFSVFIRSHPPVLLSEVSFWPRNFRKINSLPLINDWYLSSWILQSEKNNFIIFISQGQGTQKTDGISRVPSSIQLLSSADMLYTLYMKKNWGTLFPCFFLANQVLAKNSLEVIYVFVLIVVLVLLHFNMLHQTNGF